MIYNKDTSTAKQNIEGGGGGNNNSFDIIWDYCILYSVIGSNMLYITICMNWYYLVSFELCYIVKWCMIRCYVLNDIMQYRCKCTIWFDVLNEHNKEYYKKQKKSIVF